MATVGPLEDYELVAEGENLSVQRDSRSKRLLKQRKQRENDRQHDLRKLPRDSSMKSTK